MTKGQMVGKVTAIRYLPGEVELQLDDEVPQHLHSGQRIALMREDLSDGGEWKRAVIDALVCSHIYRNEHESDPDKALADLIAWECSVALDPKVSAAAAALVAAKDAEIEKLKRVCAMAYQLAGAAGANRNVLDVLSEAVDGEYRFDPLACLPIELEDKAPPQGHVVLTKTEAGELVAVTRQDAEGRILSVVWQAPQRALSPASAAFRPKIGELVMFQGREYRVIANGDTPGTLDLAMDEGGDRWLNVPPDRLLPHHDPKGERW